MARDGMMVSELVEHLNTYRPDAIVVMKVKPASAYADHANIISIDVITDDEGEIVTLSNEA
jgi:hypothetical protein